MEEEIRNIEKRDGVRLTWNVWPSKGTELNSIPLACLYNIHQSAPLLESGPISCNTCRSVLNPHSSIDFSRQSWFCVICGASNALPAHARGLTPDYLLPELLQENTTIEYVLNGAEKFQPVFIFVVDQCSYDLERHELLKKALKVSLEGIPDDALVGMIKFGTNIELIELNRSKPKRVYLFSGKKEYNSDIVKNLNPSNNKTGISIIDRFLVRKDQCHEFLLETIESLEMDPFPVLNAYKPVRCTGAAMSLAYSLCSTLFADTPVKYLLYTQGPCTFGPGTVTPIKYKEKGKNENIDDNDPMYIGPAEKFFTSLSEKIAESGHSVDILAATIVDIGISCMKTLATATGGMIIMAQDFSPAIYLTSCEKIFDKGESGELLQGFNARMHVLTTKNLEYKGIIKGIGIKSNTGWKIGSIFPSSNVSILFDRKGMIKHGEFGYVQILTQYQRSDRKLILRVTTFARIFTENSDEVIASFDQEAATVFMARSLLLKKYEEARDLERTIEKGLVRFTKAFSKYKRGMPETVVLPDSMSYYPNYMFFFRRSLLVQTGNNSPDETAYYKNLLYREKVSQALKLIKPTLLSYHYHGTVQPVEMDSSSLQPDVILVLDTFHNVLIWKGAYIVQWIKDGYHEMDEYVFLKEILEKSDARAKELCKRLPTPKFDVTEPHKSAQRILQHYVNPSG